MHAVCELNRMYLISLRCDMTRVRRVHHTSPPRKHFALRDDGAHHRQSANLRLGHAHTRLPGASSCNDTALHFERPSLASSLPRPRTRSTMPGGSLRCSQHRRTCHRGHAVRGAVVRNTPERCRDSDRCAQQTPSSLSVLYTLVTVRPLAFRRDTPQVVAGCRTAAALGGGGCKSLWWRLAVSSQSPVCGQSVEYSGAPGQRAGAGTAHREAGRVQGTLQIQGVAGA